MQKARRATNARDEILDAAQRVAMRDGAGHVTIDSVAREAQVSKGGVLYHFPSKEKMLKAMLERLIETMRPRIEAFREEHAGSPNRTLRAMIQASQFKNDIDPQISMAIMAAAAQNPDLLEPVRDEMRLRFEQIRAEGCDMPTALLLWAAIDGLMFNGLFKTLPISEAEHQALLEKLDTLAQKLCY